MIVNFGSDIRRNDTGKHKFLQRLSKEMRKFDVQINKKNPDVFLYINKKTKFPMSNCTKIMRLDGLILNISQNYKGKNKALLSAIHKADALIYQSKFCKDAYTRFLRVKKPHICIFNGADPSEFLPRNPNNIFFTACRWRPHKRLKDICNGFLMSLSQGLDADLIVAGDIDKKIKNSRIHYVGWIKPPKIAEFLSQSLGFIHISWLDWCPNAMIEAIVAGCPLIYSKSGGNKEIGEGFGFGINDKEWDFKPCKLYYPPEIDIKEISNCMLKLKFENNTFHGDPSKFYINNIATQYINFFNTTLNI